MVVELILNAYFTTGLGTYLHERSSPPTRPSCTTLSRPLDETNRAPQTPPKPESAPDNNVRSCRGAVTALRQGFSEMGWSFPCYLMNLAALLAAFVYSTAFFLKVSEVQ